MQQKRRQGPAIELECSQLFGPKMRLISVTVVERVDHSGLLPAG